METVNNNEAEVRELVAVEDSSMRFPQCLLNKNSYTGIKGLVGIGFWLGCVYFLYGICNFFLWGGTFWSFLFDFINVDKHTMKNGLSVIEYGEYPQSALNIKLSKKLINYNNLFIEFDEGTTILTGENAQGKTNLLESLFIMGLGKSFRTLNDSEMISFGCDQARAVSYVVNDDEDDESFDKGVINPDLDDLAIDLWTKDNNRMYEYKDEIDFVAYYYNFEKSSKKNYIIIDM